VKFRFVDILEFALAPGAKKNTLAFSAAEKGGPFGKPAVKQIKTPEHHAPGFFIKTIKQNND